MRKTIIITCLILAGLLILERSGILTSLLFFFLVGAVPGTNYSLPSGFMLVVAICAMWFVVVRFTLNDVLYSIFHKRSLKHTTEHKKRMPKRRFSQI